MTALALILILAPPPVAVPPAPGPERPAPRVCLVLSGGGARGAAEVGVLKVLEEERVPIDMVVGTSIGAILGGLYATGWRPAEIEELLRTISYTSLFVDSPVRDDKSFRRKQDDRDFLVPLKLRLKGGRPYLPPSALGGQRLETLLRTLEIDSTDARDFDELPIRFRAVAADLGTGKAVILKEGSLATAMRASMSIAGLFPPVAVGELRLVDGGAAANLPIRIAQELGAERIIAVDTTSALRPTEDLDAIFGVFDQINTFLTAENRAEDIAALRPGDLLIAPPMEDLFYSDFARIDEAILLGERAAREAVERIRAFSVGEAEYARYRERLRRRPSSSIVPSVIRIENNSWVKDAIVREALTTRIGEPLDTVTLSADIHRLDAMGYFGTVRHWVERSPEGGILVVETPPRRHGRNSLQFGINFNDDFRGEAGYALSVRHQLLAANRSGGEWQNIAQIGDRSILATEFYQPLGAKMAWFVVPALEARRRSTLVWEDGDPLSEYRVSGREGRLEGGRVLGRWGEIRAGLFAASVGARVRIGPEIVPDLREREGGYRLRFRVDTLDAVAFPRQGLDVEASMERSAGSLGAERDYALAWVRASGAMSAGKNTFVPSLEAGKFYRGEPTLESSFTLGGLLRLSGFGIDELKGPRYGLASLIYYREMTGFDLGSLSPRLYAGISLEAGNTWREGEPLVWRTLHRSAGLFVGGRTPIGPVTLAYAWSERGDPRIYLNIGGRF